MKKDQISGRKHLQEALNRLHRKHANCDDGTVASYIPELAKANPDHFGIAVAEVDGEVWEVGETSVEFTVQSISKAFLFGLAVETHGRDAVLKRIGVEPSGEAYHRLPIERKAEA